MTRSRWGWRRSTAIGAITALAVGALASFAAAVSSSGTPAAVSQYGKKVTICHHTHSKKHPFVTITISQNALPAHLRHGRHGRSVHDCRDSQEGSTARKERARQEERGRAAHPLRSHPKTADSPSQGLELARAFRKHTWPLRKLARPQWQRARPQRNGARPERNRARPQRNGARTLWKRARPRRHPARPGQEVGGRPPQSGGLHRRT